MMRGMSVAHVRSVLRPHPPKALSATTCTSPVDSSAAVTPGALSAMTLSPRIQARSGSAGETTRPAGSVTGGTLDAARVTGAGLTFAVEASTGGTVAASTTPTTATIPAGMRTRRHQPLHCARRRGRSTTTALNQAAPIMAARRQVSSAAPDRPVFWVVSNTMTGQCQR